MRNIQTLHGEVQAIHKTVHNFHRITVGQDAQPSQVVLLRSYDCPCKVGDRLSIALHKRGKDRREVLLALINRATGEGLFRTGWELQPWPRNGDLTLLCVAVVGVLLTQGIAGWPWLVVFGLLHWLCSAVLARHIARQRIARLAYRLDCEHMQAESSL